MSIEIVGSVELALADWRLISDPGEDGERALFKIALSDRFKWGAIHIEAPLVDGKPGISNLGDGDSFVGWLPL